LFFPRSPHVEEAPQTPPLLLVFIDLELESPVTYVCVCASLSGTLSVSPKKPLIVCPFFSLATQNSSRNWAPLFSPCLPAIQGAIQIATLFAPPPPPPSPPRMTPFFLFCISHRAGLPVPPPQSSIPTHHGVSQLWLFESPRFLSGNLKLPPPSRERLLGDASHFPLREGGLPFSPTSLL